MGVERKEGILFRGKRSAESENEKKAKKDNRQKNISWKEGGRYKRIKGLLKKNERVKESKVRRELWGRWI